MGLTESAWWKASCILLCGWFICRLVFRACHALWLVICRRGFWRFSRRERSGSILLDPVRASNAENRQKPPGPQGWVENGLAAALRLAFSPHRGCALAASCRQPVLNPTNDQPKCMTGSSSTITPEPTTPAGATGASAAGVTAGVAAHLTSEVIRQAIF